MATFAHEPMGEQHRPAAAVTQTVYRRYLLILVFLPLVAFLVAVPFARTQLFERLSRRMFWHAMDYHVRMAGQRCDLVIYGDSTGLTGIDPVILKQETGLEACMLAMPYMTLSTTGTWTLDHFLALSPAPRAIAFVYHPRHLRAPALDEDTGVVDGWLMKARVASLREALHFFLTHGDGTITFMENVWQQVFTMNYRVLDLTERTYYRDMRLLRAHSGHFAITEALPLDIVCEAETEPMPAFDSSYLPSLQKKYEKPGTRVLFYISPVRSCDPSVPQYDALAQRLNLQPPRVYPATDFADTNHLLPSAVPQNTDDFTAMLRKVDPELMQASDTAHH